MRDLALFSDLTVLFISKLCLGSSNGGIYSYHVFGELTKEFG